ncbi:hypothetical protein [Acetobacter fabarum]|uniref:Uncharacterized protein n=1 Tax=Acetobacter fabarum TaxID=483199 RepID=A0A269XV49_9PROT|nr:hypothetical protein [Acetobacter fabarum]PAK77154.1 hypothetical protein B8X00_11350 [Acetobacter fabarum]PEN22934.1 hypothetical protein CRM93_12680 [Acetobacter fabarum]
MDSNFKGDPRAYKIAAIQENHADEFDSCVAAAIEYMRRKARKTHPPGTFDSVGRFYADERTQAVRSCRSPSRAWPMPEMKAARTVAHVAEVFEVGDLVTEIRQIVNFADARCADDRDLRRLIDETLKFVAENPKKTRKPKPAEITSEADAPAQAAA